METHLRDRHDDTGTERVPIKESTRDRPHSGFTIVATLRATPEQAVAGLTGPEGHRLVAS